MADRQPNKPGTKAWLAVLLIISLFGSAVILYHTRQGAGASGDAVLYVQGAINMLAGNGYGRLSGGGEVVPITGFPPGFSAVLAFTGIFTQDLFSGGRVLNVILFGLTIFGAGFLTLRVTKSGLASLAAALLVTSAQNLIKVYGWIMSEGLFIVLMLAALILFLFYLESGKRLFLVAASAAITFSTLTRFVGLSLMPAFCLIILVSRRETWKDRLIDCLIVAAITLVPFFAWLQRNAALAGTMTNRSIVYHPMSKDLVYAFISEMVAWFIPRQVPLSTTIKGIFGLAAILVASGWSVWRALIARRNEPVGGLVAAWFPCLMILSILSYLATLVINSTFLDSSTSLAAAGRYLTPVFVLAVILVVTLTVQLINKAPYRRLASGLALLAFLGLLFIYGYRTFEFIRQPGPVFGYTDYRRANPDLTSALQELDSNRLLISNNVELTYFLAGRPAYALPILYDHYTQQYRADYQEQLARADSRLKNGALIVIIGQSDDTELELLDLLQVQTVSTFNDVTFYSR